MSINGVFNPVFNSNKGTAHKITDENVAIFGATMMLTAMINSLISRSVSSTKNDVNLSNLTNYAFMFGVVLATIETENSLDLQHTCMVLGKCLLLIVTFSLSFHYFF